MSISLFPLPAGMIIALVAGSNPAVWVVPPDVHTTEIGEFGPVMTKRSSPSSVTSDRLRPEREPMLRIAVLPVSATSDEISPGIGSPPNVKLVPKSKMSIEKLTDAGPMPTDPPALAPNENPPSPLNTSSIASTKPEESATASTTFTISGIRSFPSLFGSLNPSRKYASPDPRTKAEAIAMLMEADASNPIPKSIRPPSELSIKIPSNNRSGCSVSMKFTIPDRS